MNDGDLGPQPTPVAEPGDPNPGGVDAIAENDGAPMPADLDPDDNPATDDFLPGDVGDPDEEKSQAPEGDADDQESGSEREPEAGQETEDGGVEPPA